MEEIKSQIEKAIETETAEIKLLSMGLAKSSFLAELLSSLKQ